MKVENEAGDPPPARALVAAFMNDGERLHKSRFSVTRKSQACLSKILSFAGLSGCGNSEICTFA